MTLDRPIAIAVLLCASVGLVACSPPAPASTRTQPPAVTPPATSTVAPTSTTPAGPPAVVPSGALHTPAMGSAERTALMGAARAFSGLSAGSKFVVRQLKSDGAWAVGELSLGSKTSFYAFRNQVDGGWKAFSSGPAGSSSKATHSDPRLSRAVVAAIDWTGMPTESEMVAAAKRLAKATGTIVVGGAKFGSATQDSKGRWWAEVDITNNIDGAIVIIYRDHGTWKLFDAGTGIDPSSLPPDVKLEF